MAMDLTAMTGANAPGGWELAAGMFTAALDRNTDFLTPLLRAHPSVVDLRVDVVPAGPAGWSRIEFRDTGELIYSGVRKVDTGVLTKATMERRGLRLVIELNGGASVGTGQALETLCHEYGGHLCPWGDYLMMLHRPANPEHVPLLEGMLERSMEGDLMGGVQHLAIAEGRSVYFEGLATAISGIVQSASGQILHDFNAAKTADMQSLLGTAQPLSRLLAAWSQPGDSDTE